MSGRKLAGTRLILMHSEKWLYRNTSKWLLLPTTYRVIFSHIKAVWSRYERSDIRDDDGRREAI
jgi:hypothetical protein